MFAMLLGHLVGDYLFQNEAMAMNKTKKGIKGLSWCTLHCLIYTATVCLFLWTANPLVIALIFLSHWPIDRWSLASKWLKLIRGRDMVEAYKSKNSVNISFSCIVYAVADNTMHLVLMWLICIYLL